jgi:hypothetical protein
MAKPNTYMLLVILFLWMVFGMFAIVLLNVFPGLFNPWLLIAPVFFSLFALFTIKRVALNTQVKISALMASKTLRLLLSMVVILLYILLIKVNSILFVVTFGSFFILYLVVETWIMVQMNKHKTKKA